MIEIYDNSNDDLVGEITEAQLEFLIEELEETSESDRDYQIDAPTLLALEEAGADDDLLEVLQNALGDADLVEVRWELTDDRLERPEEEDAVAEEV